jgi:choline kinase
MVKKAVIIAAGRGSRLHNGKSVSKPLTKLLGVPLIKRIMLSVHQAGISEFVIVTGFMADDLQGFVANDPDLAKFKIDFVHNDEWNKSNGISVLTAAQKVQENFVLLMADHIFDVSTLERLNRVQIGSDEVVLCIDRKLDSIFDMDDATKVKTSQGRIVAISKTLPEYNAVDTGMFLCSPALFSVLERAKVNNDCSLSQGIDILARDSKMKYFEIEDGWWQDVDTPPTMKHAEEMIIQKALQQDSLVSRALLYPAVLTRFVRAASKIGINANLLTTISMIIGFCSSLLLMQQSYLAIIVGAVLFQITSLSSGLSQKLLRVSLIERRFSQIYNTLVNNLISLFFVMSLILGVYSRKSEGYILIIGCFVLIGTVMTMGMKFAFLRRRNQDGKTESFGSLLNRFIMSKKYHLLGKFFKQIHMLSKWYVVATIFVILAFMNQLEWGLWAMAVMVNLMWAAIFLNRTEMERFYLTDRKSKVDL